MKIMMRALIIAVVILFVPAALFAFGVDFGVYIGPTWGGKLDTGNETAAVAANQDATIPISYEWGFIGHVNHHIIPEIISAGVGGFYQYAPMDYKYTDPATNRSTKYDATKKTYGFDFFFQVDLIPLIHPYGRYAIAIEERIDLKVPNGAGTTTKETNNKYFQSHYVGLGVNITVFPLVRIFGEYMYNTATMEHGVDLKSNSFHIGARLEI